MFDKLPHPLTTILRMYSHVRSFVFNDTVVYHGSDCVFCKFLNVGRNSRKVVLDKLPRMYPLTSEFHKSKRTGIGSNRILICGQEPVSFVDFITTHLPFSRNSIIRLPHTSPVGRIGTVNKIKKEDNLVIVHSSTMAPFFYGALRSCLPLGVRCFVIAERLEDESSLRIRGPNEVIVYGRRARKGGSSADKKIANMLVYCLQTNNMRVSVCSFLQFSKRFRDDVQCKHSEGLDIKTTYFGI